MKCKLPNLFIVGAGKCGTTSLYYYLKQHSKIYLPDFKEPQYLSFKHFLNDIEKVVYPHKLNEFVLSENEYFSLYRNDDIENKKYIGDASTAAFVFYEEFYKSVQQYYEKPQTNKIIIILRNPIEATISHYLMYKRIFEIYNGAKYRSLEEAIKIEKKMFQNKYYAICHTFRYKFFDRIKFFKNHFDDVLILFHEDLKYNKDKVLTDIFTFLDIEKENINTSENLNETIFPKNSFAKIFYKDSKFKILTKKILPSSLYISLKKTRDNFLGTKQKNISEKEILILQNIFKEDIIKTSELLKKDLTKWIK